MYYSFGQNKTGGTTKSGTEGEKFLPDCDKSMGEWVHI